MKAFIIIGNELLSMTKLEMPEHTSGNRDDSFVQSMLKLFMCEVMVFEKRIFLIPEQSTFNHFHSPNDANSAHSVFLLKGMNAQNLRFRNNNLALSLLAFPYLRDLSL